MITIILPKVVARVGCLANRIQFRVWKPAKNTRQQALKLKSNFKVLRVLHS